MAEPGASRERILGAAETLFSQRGFHLTSVDDIAERAGVAKGTVFYNFGSKAALFETVLHDGMDAIYAAIHQELATDRPATEQIGSILEMHVRTLLGRPGLLAIFSRELSSGLEDTIRQTIRRTRLEYLTFVAGLLEEARASGIVKELDSVMLASTLFDIALSACSYVQDASPALDAGPVAAFVKTLVLEGILRRD